MPANTSYYTLVILNLFFSFKSFIYLFLSFHIYVLSGFLFGFLTHSLSQIFFNFKFKIFLQRKGSNNEIKNKPYGPMYFEHFFHQPRQKHGCAVSVAASLIIYWTKSNITKYQKRHQTFYTKRQWFLFPFFFFG